MKELMNMSERLLEAEFVRDEKSNQLLLRVKTCRAIENFFKTQEIAESSVYKNSESVAKKYYKLRDENVNKEDLYSEIENEIYRKFNISIYLRQYGNKIINNNEYNISILRTVNISKDFIEIVVNDLLSTEQMKNFIEALRITVAYIFKKYIKTVRIKCILEADEVM